MNAADLSATGMTELRSLALRIAAAGLRACDPAQSTRAAVRLTRDGIAVGEHEYSLGPESRVLVLGSGKATLPIASTLETILGDRLSGGAIAVRAESDRAALDRIELLVADHPLPSERSEAAASRLLELADGLSSDDLVIAVFTGGSSALTSMAPKGVPQPEKRRLHELLLASGASIAEVNTVRKHVSAFKGGRFAAHVAPAQLVNLTISDVAGDVLDVLTDPSVQDTSTPGDAIEVLHRYDLWADVPESVRAHLSSDAAQSPRLEADPQTVLLANGPGVCEAMVRAATAEDLDSQIVATDLEGEAVDVGRLLAERARPLAGPNDAPKSPRVLVGCGGEATVTLRAERTQAAFGAGGPNQEVAIAAALALPGAKFAGVFMDTDGSDGGSDAAGAIVDGDTPGRARAMGVDLPEALERHSSAEALSRLGDQVLTGPTHTNVNDLFVLVAAGASAAGFQPPGETDLGDRDRCHQSDDFVEGAQQLALPARGAAPHPRATHGIHSASEISVRKK